MTGGGSGIECQPLIHRRQPIGGEDRRGHGHIGVAARQLRRDAACLGQIERGDGRVHRLDFRVVHIVNLAQPLVRRGRLEQRPAPRIVGALQSVRNQAPRRLPQRARQQARQVPPCRSGRRVAQQRQGSLEVLATVGMTAKRIMRFAEMGVPVCPPNGVAEVRRFLVQRHRLSKEADGFLIGKVVHRVDAGQFQVMNRLRVVLGLGVMVRQHRIIRRQIRGIFRLMPRGDGPMQVAPLRKQHQVVGDLLGDQMLEDIDPLGQVRLQQG